MMEQKKIDRMRQQCLRRVANGNTCFALSASTMLILLDLAENEGKLRGEVERLRANSRGAFVVDGERVQPRDYRAVCQYLAADDNIIAELKAENQQLRAERDSALTDLETGFNCFACIKLKRNGGNCLGGKKYLPDACIGFKWRSPQNEQEGSGENGY